MAPQNTSSIPSTSSTPVGHRRPVGSRPGAGPGADGDAVQAAKDKPLRRLLVRLVVLLVCFGVAALHVVEYVQWRQNRDQLVAMLSGFGLDDFNQTGVRNVARERAPHRAQLVAARTIVHQVMSPDLDERGLPIIPADKRLAALDEAERLARLALQSESEAWQASMLVGASVYLRRSLANDRRLVTESADWEEPLRRAVDSVNKTEPRRILAAAYLETWNYLSPEKKLLTQDLLAHVFRNDERALRRLMPIWLQLAESEDDAFAVVPEVASAWTFVKYTYAQGHRWGPYARAHARYLDALEQQLIVVLDDAEQRSRLGDKEGSRELCLQTVMIAPRQRRFVPIVERAFEIYPPGLQGLRVPEGIADWVRWAVALDAVQVHPFTTEAIDELMETAGKLDTAVAAHAALLANNVYNVNRYERQTAHRSTLEWAPFLLAKARRLAAEGDAGGAQEALDDLDLASGRSFQAWQMRAAIAALQEDFAAQAEAEGKMLEFEKQRWTALDWSLRNLAPVLHMAPSAAASGLSLEIVETGARGDAVGFYLDGELIQLQAVISREHYEIDVALSQQPHLLEVRSVSGQPVLLGRVELLGVDR